jgi:hypothetical protein
MLIVTLFSLTAFTSNIFAEDIKEWKLGKVQNNPGSQMMQLKPFPEYFKIKQSQDSSEGELIVKMRNQNSEKKYNFSLNSSVTTESVQVYGVPNPNFAAKEIAVVEHLGDKIIISMKWTRPDRPQWKTSSEYTISFKENGNLHFLRINGKNTEATYLEFDAEYILE